VRIGSAKIHAAYGAKIEEEIGYYSGSFPNEAFLPMVSVFVLEAFLKLSKERS
jgi:hypothetical protein